MQHSGELKKNKVRIMKFTNQSTNFILKRQQRILSILVKRTETEFNLLKWKNRSESQKSLKTK